MRKLLFSSLFVALLLLMVPNISALQYNLIEETIEENIVAQTQSNLRFFHMKNLLEQIHHVHILNKSVLDLLTILLVIGGIVIPTIFIVIGEVLIKILSPGDLTIELIRIIEGFVIGFIAAYIDDNIEERY